MRNRKYVVLKHLSTPNRTIIGKSNKVKIVKELYNRKLANKAFNKGKQFGKMLSLILS